MGVLIGSPFVVSAETGKVGTLQSGTRRGDACQHKGHRSTSSCRSWSIRCASRSTVKEQAVLVSGWQQALTLLLAVIPGFVYQGTRLRLRGPTPDAREIGVRILRALAGSGFAALAYVVVLGPALTTVVTRPVNLLEHPRRPTSCSPRHDRPYLPGSDGGCAPTQGL